ncbi:unnamed protein product [Ectocarpus sp. 8 AP-2014]
MCRLNTYFHRAAYMLQFGFDKLVLVFFLRPSSLAAFRPFLLRVELRKPLPLPRQRYDPTDPEGVMGLAHSKGGSGSSSAAAASKSPEEDREEDEKEEDDEEMEEEEVWEKEEDVQLDDPAAAEGGGGGGAGAADLPLLGGGAGKGLAMSDVCIVVDSGFSFTHILPFYQGRALHKSALRVNVGGKLLTNYLKEVVSYRQWNMMDEFEVRLGSSSDFSRRSSLQICFSPSDGRSVAAAGAANREFVLPDRKTVMKGFAREVDWDARVKRRQQEELGVEDEQQPQVLTMGNERFHIPEVLFNPSNIGLRQMGLSEAVATCIERCPAALRPQFYANVLLTGGNCAIPNLRERLYRNLRASAPIHCEVNVILPEEPMLHAWRGGSLFGASPEFGSFAVSKQEYDEFGHHICKIRYADW